MLNSKYTNGRTRYDYPNGKLYTAMIASGYSSAYTLAQAAKVTPNSVGDYLALTKSPFRLNGSYQESINKISSVLGVDPLCLFPEWFIVQNEPNQLVSVVDLSEVSDVIDDQLSAQDHIELSEARLVIMDVLLEISPRSRDIVLLRLGFYDRIYPIREIEARYNINKDRVSSMVTRAMNRLRRSDRSDELKIALKTFIKHQ